MANSDWYDIPIVGKDPELPWLHLFEGEFQLFMHGSYSRTLDEDWERYYAQVPKYVPTACPHGKTKLTCEQCYFKNHD